MKTHNLLGNELFAFQEKPIEIFKMFVRFMESDAGMKFADLNNGDDGVK